MSFRVLVIPEDPTWNGYILTPLAKTLLADAEKPASKVTLLTNPRLRGYDQARRAIRDELPDRYGFFDLWLFFPDADRANADAMQHLEAELRTKGITLFCCPAQPEVEIYACVAFRDDLPNNLGRRPHAYTDERGGLRTAPWRCTATRAGRVEAET